MTRAAPNDVVHLPPRTLSARRSVLRRPSVSATVLLAATGLMFSYPFLWMLLAGFKSNLEIFRPGQLWPGSWNSEYYGQLLAGKWFPFGRVFWNSLCIATLQALGTVGLASLAGYAFARHRLPGGRWLFLTAVLVMVWPVQALAVPLFTWLNRLGLVDHPLGVILPGMVSGLGVIYFTQVFRQIPNDLVDLARIEGASEWRIYWTLLPLVRGGLLSFGLIQFILAWHDHLLPLLVLNTAGRQTLPIALSALYGSSLRFPFAVLMAGSTFTLLPTAILFALLHRRLKTALADTLY